MRDRGRRNIPHSKIYSPGLRAVANGVEEVRPQRANGRNKLGLRGQDVAEPMAIQMQVADEYFCGANVTGTIMQNCLWKAFPQTMRNYSPGYWIAGARISVRP